MSLEILHTEGIAHLVGTTRSLRYEMTQSTIECNGALCHFISKGARTYPQEGM